MQRQTPCLYLYSVPHSLLKLVCWPPRLLTKHCDSDAGKQQLNYKKKITKADSSSAGTTGCCDNRYTGCCNTSSHQWDLWISVTWLLWHAFSLRVPELANLQWHPWLWKSHCSPAVLVFLPQSWLSFLYNVLSLTNWQILSLVFQFIA